MKLIKSFSWYFVFITIAIIFSFITRNSSSVFELFNSKEQSIYLVLAILFSVGYALNYFSPRTRIPSFVWAIFFGMALQPILGLIIGNTHTLKIIIELLAAMVLFAGGIEVPFKNFKKYFAPIASISILGTIITIFIFGLSMEHIGAFFSSPIPPISFLIMAAILSSTDPTAIIPALKELRLKKPFLKDIIISESAVNDVVGSIFTRFFLVVILATASIKSVPVLFKPILQRDSIESLVLEIVWGSIVGLVSAVLLKKWSNHIKKVDKEKKSDPAFFFAIPIFAFAGGSLIGGSGFLAAFLAGLLFESNGSAKEAHHFFDLFVTDFIKPIIFMLLGALTPITILLDNAFMGIVFGIVFILIIRPFVVFLTLSPWFINKKTALFSLNDLLFISFIRETGVIPAVLMLVALSVGIPFPQEIFAIGMWVILVTLTIEPPLIPIVAKKLKLLEEIKSK